MKPKFILPVVLVSMLFCFGGSAYAAWQIKYDSEANRVLHLGGNTLRGNFANKEQCVSYWRSRPYFEQAHSQCVGYDSPGGYGGYGGSGNFYQNLFMGLMNNLIQGFNQGLSARPQGPSPQQRALWEQQQRQKQAEYRTKMREQIKKLEQEYNKIATAEFEKNKDNLISDFKSRYAATIGREETSMAIQQLNCSAYWGLKAARMFLDGDDERDLYFARLYAEYSASAKKGDPLSGKCSEVSEIEVQIPPVGAPQPANFQKDFYKYIVQETEKLQPVIRDLREKKKNAADIIAAKKKEIEDLENRRNSSSKEEDEEDVDNLLKDAYEALNEATEEKKKVEEKLSEMNKKLAALEEMRSFYDVEKPSKEVKK